MCKSKIHRATVTQANVNYRGSLGLDKKLMYAANILPNERVFVLNLANGERIVTYAIVAAESSGTVCLNGPAALLGKKGDKVIILTYGLYDEKEVKKQHMKVIFVDEKNRIIREK